ncbi:uncharacterized protein Z518_04675 [Rhinocladiella mackenziei CBS 650.93]|uniref:aldehyde dehydrogenase (NAD(+)) n=1 Tax=Rhinocladiella mackenziei CBS 650.93 TaxID=1442369 RepID=A0A0D2ILQ6_9EURO|nr:uncharacterized protein Z518_04675 [Rhinocladiella mackenziei CBS 650.93]KIX06699.1 hypothetical protein Z518_04675 [Rhinocladiella mackenziei CBS 650.93]
MAGTGFETRLFINGEYVDAKTQSRLTCYNPIDNSVVTSDVHVALKDDVNDAVVAARRAFPGWAAASAVTKSKAMLRVADLIEEHAEAFARLESICSGKPFVSTTGYEAAMAANTFRYYAGFTDKLEGESFPPDNGFMRVVQREPIGVCAAINAFNGPLIMLANKSAPCLAAGNTIIIKASEKTPLSTLFFGKLANEAGFPAGTVNLICGGAETGALLASHMDIDKISFTGSGTTGKKIAQAAAASNLKRVTLELGGKSPSIIFPDAHMDVAVNWCVQGITANTGQACIASSRVYVHRDIKQQFIDRIRTVFEGLHMAMGKDVFDQGTQIGPLVDKAHFDRVSSFVAHGKQEATLVTGGQALYDQGCWFTPTLFIDPYPDAKIYKEEIFGPVVVVSEFEDERDVIQRANNTTFGLSGAVFSQDINRALRVASQIRSGTVCVNCCTMIDYTVPFGGMKQSGWGRELGKDGILAYTEPKTMFIK